jgi:glycosyltransferase involved in cell wall biosynthesis
VNILFVNETCGYFGGVEQNIADTVSGLSARGHVCHLAYGTTSQRDPEEYRSLFQGVFMCSEAGASRETGIALSISQIVEQMGPDVVYLHKVPGIAPYLNLMGVPRVVRMVHDHDLCCPRRHKYFIHNGRICHYPMGLRCWLDGAFIARNPASTTGFAFVNIHRKHEEMRRNYGLDALLVGSRFMREELLQNGFPSKKVHILPPVIRMTPSQLLPLPKEPRLLFVGQLIRGKGVDLLLKALHRLSCDVTATIVGTGNAEAGLRVLCNKLGLDSKVDFIGWVPNDAIGPIYSGARVVAVPSRWPEPFGMIGLEAMQHGRPIVAFAVGGIPDWLEHGVNGLMAPEQDVEALAAAIETILTDTRLAVQMGETGLQRVRSQYAFDRYLSDLEVYLMGDFKR